jgi:DNA-binding SARP family transcriptional activator
VFARAVLLLAAMAIGVPLALVLAARERFGGASPFHGVPPPAEWSAGRVRSVLSDRLTDQTIADIVIRLSLVVAWAAVFVLVMTVALEAIHMIRHDGMAMPDVRGLGAPQRAARIVASGLLTVLPLLTSSGTVVARTAGPLIADRPVDLTVDRVSVGQVVVTPALAPVSPPRDEAPLPVEATNYVVQPGDSIFAIAERIAGPDTSSVGAYATRLVDVNMGREMGDGRRFTNAAFIDVGWVLELPGRSIVPSPQRTSDDTVGHLVEQGESLWSIADRELGDPTRWPEVFAANEGRPFADGSTLTNADLIRPGWNLRLPVADELAPSRSDPAGETVEPPVQVETAGTDTVATDTVATDTAPTETVPAEMVPADTAPTDTAPTEMVPAEMVPADTIPADTIPADTVPADTAPTDTVDDVALRTMPDPEVQRSIDGAAATPAVTSETPPRASTQRDNVWDTRSPGANAARERMSNGLIAVGDPDDAAVVPGVLMLGGAAMLSSGALTLLSVRRRRQLRRSRSRARLTEPTIRRAATERALRAIDTGERFQRVELAIRAVAHQLVESGGRVLAVSVAPDGALELRATVVVGLGFPWAGSGSAWRLAASTPIELLVEAADGVCPPCPTLVQLGTDDEGRDVYVDLETIEAIEIGGRGADADAIVAAIAATLAGSQLAEVTTLVGFGVPDDAFLGHRRHVPALDARQAFEAAAASIGSTASMATSTFALRTHGTADETWEPAVVLAGAAGGTIDLPGRRTGLAVVSASPICGPSSRLEPDGDAWILRPAGIRLIPVGLTPDDITALSELVTVIDVDPGSGPDGAEFDDDQTIVSTDRRARRAADASSSGAILVLDDEEEEEEGEEIAAPVPPHVLVVRLLGPVVVVDGDGRPAVFERSKARELVAWLATHRERATRSAARTALWELDVRDATFANVVSEARRSLARLVEPPTGEEWVGRTMTDALPLHAMVTTDADLIRCALEIARMQPPAQAIATLTPAVELITGMPFEGTSYLWPDGEGITSSLVLLATTAATELAAHCLSVGDIEGVFEATGRGLQVLPGQEELIGLRMQAHARAGDHAGVRLEWESYERVINADPWSDGEPAPKLVELRRQLLNPSR